MKKHLSITVYILFAMLFIACEKDLRTYEGKSTIYFLHALSSIYPNLEPSDSLNLTFAFSPEKTDSVQIIPVRVTGEATETDRSFTVSADPVSTAKAGEHYERIPGGLVIPAGNVVGEVPIKFLRTPEMETDTFTLVLKLQPNEHFVTNMADKVENATTGKVRSFRQFRVMVNDVLNRPMRWLDYYCGTFTRKKLVLMSSVLDIPLDAMNKTTATIPNIIYWSKSMQLYLNDQRASGNIIYEEDGTEMVMGPGVQ